MRTISGDFTIAQHTKGTPDLEMKGSFKAQKPNRFTIDFEGSIPIRFVSDGKTVLTLIKSVNGYSQVPFDDQSMNQTVTSVAPLTLFFNQHKLLAPDTPTRYAGIETWKGASCEVVEQTLGTTIMRFYIGPDRIVERMTVRLEQQGKTYDVDASIARVSRDPSLTDSDFDVSPPKGGILVEMPRSGVTPIAVGHPAPGFSLPQPGGGKLSLADELKTHKAVLVTFWFYACATCREEFPQLMKLYRELKPQGLEIIAVNSFDDRATILKYASEAGLNSPIVMDDSGDQHFGVAKSYGVNLYPTSYLIDGSGKVVARYIGFKEKELREALARLGCQNRG
jgi:peroxiredoxin/outer membrane lipoprotein-sorting protein